MPPLGMFDGVHESVRVFCLLTSVSSNTARVEMTDDGFAIVTD